MRILVTGSKGFIGKNLICELRNRGYNQIMEYDKDTNPILLDEYCSVADYVFHLAGVNRPKEVDEFMAGNSGFTSKLINALAKYGNNCPILMTSSIQAELDNEYGKSKKSGEKLLLEYAKEADTKVSIYRLPNVFGKWCKPNYNSVIATFCYNIARDLPIKVNDSNIMMKLVYIDDVINEFINSLSENVEKKGSFCEVERVHKIKLGEIADLLYSFKNSREDKSVPDMEDIFSKQLYSTYLSYLPSDKLSYDLTMNIDNRGSFTEFLRTSNRGQVSINVSKPGIVKGNHWHHTKNEKFLVVSGSGIIRFRNICSNEVIEYHVSGEKMQVVDIPIGYTHNIQNTGDIDMVTVMWANELYNPLIPDTYYMEV